MNSGDNLFTQWQPNILRLPAEPEFAAKFPLLLTVTEDDNWANHCRYLELLYGFLNKIITVYPPEPVALFDTGVIFYSPSWTRSQPNLNATGKSKNWQHC